MYVDAYVYRYISRVYIYTYACIYICMYVCIYIELHEPAVDEDVEREGSRLHVRVARRGPGPCRPCKLAERKRGWTNSQKSF